MVLQPLKTKARAQVMVVYLEAFSNPYNNSYINQILNCGLNYIQQLQKV